MAIYKYSEGKEREGLKGRCGGEGTEGPASATALCALPDWLFATA